MVYKSFDKETTSLADKNASSGAVKSEIMPNQELAGELRKPII